MKDILFLNAITEIEESVNSETDSDTIFVDEEEYMLTFEFMANVYRWTEFLPDDRETPISHQRIMSVEISDAECSYPNESIEDVTEELQEFINQKIA